jgi:hypothetical protein
VRVKAGVTDADYPDIPLGGWAGTVSDFDNRRRPPLYEIEWNEATLAAMHPVYQRRCARDDRAIELSWVSENDLEADPGGEPVIEQPTQLRPRPLNPEGPTDVTLAIFGLTSDDALPPFNQESLTRYHQHLSEQLKFPFPALYIGQVGPRGDPDIQIARVEGLAPLAESNLSEGLIAEAIIDGRRQRAPLAFFQAPPGERSARELQAYLFWTMSSSEEETPPPGRLWSRTRSLLNLAFISSILGLLIGAMLETLPGARLAGQIGAGIFAVLGVIFGGGFELDERKNRGLQMGCAGGLFFGLIAGIAVGAAVGGMVVAYPGSLLGLLGGVVLYKLLGALQWPRFGPILFPLLGGAVGAMVYVFLQDAGKAASGAWFGGLIGLGVGVLFFLGLSAYIGTVASSAQTEEPPA